MNWLRNWLPSYSFPIKQETTVCWKKRNSLIADISKEHENAEMQPEKRQRKMGEQSMVIYCHEQGSSSNSLHTCHLEWLSNNSAMYPRMVTLKEKMDRLYARQCDVRAEVELAEIQPGQKRREEVRHWLNEVQRKINNILIMIMEVHGASSNSNFSGSIESFIQEIDELIQRSIFPNGLVLLDQESTRLPLLLDLKPVGTSFQQNTKKILGWLEEHKHYIIGVYGMGGVGKTTLLTHIHDQLLQDSNLSHNIGEVYWVTVSQNCSVRKLQEDIAKVLGLASLQEDDEMKRAAVLYNRLTARGRTVLILDDMWKRVSVRKVGIPLESGKCKIILSTRSNDVCREMGCGDFVIKAEILPEGEAWDMFVDKLGQYGKLEEKAKKIALDVAKECGGLPLAIATIGGSMSGVLGIDEWKIALEELKFALGQADIEEDVIPILRYSYDRLNDKRVQKCFLSCILYCEDEKIERATLIDLWVNEGLFDEYGSRDAQIAKGNVILKKLENSCLLESVSNDKKCVKMHDLIRDMVKSITRKRPHFMAEAGKQLKKLPKEKWSKDLVKISLSHNNVEEIPSGMSPMSQKLTVLMLNGNPLKFIPDSFFVHMRSLTVLDLSKTEIERVPKSVSNLENLRALLLGDCEQLIYVPSVAKLTKLRMLDLRGSLNLAEAPRGLEKLECVEALYIPWDVSDMMGFNKLIQSLTSLSCYRFWIRDPTLCKSIDVWKRFLDEEKLVWIAGGEFGEDVSRCLLPTTLESLVINESDMKGRSLGDVFPSLLEATDLKSIRIRDCRGLEYISGSSVTQEGCSSLCAGQLAYLELDSLPNLRSITKLGAPDYFSHLRVIIIFGCPKLRVIFPFSQQLHLPNLEKFKVALCAEVSEIFESNKGTLSNPILSLPNLQELCLECLPKMKVVFPSAQQFNLPHLSNIVVGYCEKVVEIFDSSNSTLSNSVLALPSLNSLILADLPNLGSICKGVRLDTPKLGNTRLFQPMPSIRNCPKLKMGGVLIREC